MTDVLDRSEAFAELAAQLGAADGAAESLGLVPPHIAEAFSANDNLDLAAGWEPRPFDFTALSDACHAIPAERFRDYKPWRELVGGLAWAAVQYPEHESALHELMHKVSSQPGAYEAAFPNGYDRAANDAAWDRLFRDTARKVAQGASVTTTGTIFQAAQAAGWTSQIAPQTLQKSAFSHRLSDLLKAPIHKRQPEHGDLLQIGELTILNSPGGVGKSTYLVGVALAMAGGLPLLGQKVHSRRRVLMISLEEPAGELLLKVRAALSHHSAHHRLPTDLADWVDAYGAGELPDLTLTRLSARSGRDEVNPQGLRELRRVIMDARAEVVLIDPLSMLLPNSMNDNGVIYQVMQGVKQIAADLRCSVLIAAHTRKGGTLEADGAEATLGAVALTNAARTVKGIRRVGLETCKAIGVPFGREGSVREIVDQKSNFTPLGSGHYVELVSVQVPNAQPPDYPFDDRVAVAVPFAPQAGGRLVPPAAVRDALVQLARGTNGGADPYSYAKQGGPKATNRYFGPDVAQAIAPHFPGVAAARLLEAAKDTYREACDRGWVEPFDTKIGRNVRKGIRVKWAATPWAQQPQPSGAYVV